MYFLRETMSTTSRFPSTLAHLRLGGQHGSPSQQGQKTAPSGHHGVPISAQRLKVRRSLKLSTLEAIPGSIVLAINDTVVIPLGMALRATALQVSLLGSLPFLMAALAQLASPTAIKRLGSRRRMLQLCCVLSALAWACVIVVPLFPSPTQVWALLMLIVIARTFFDLPSPAWGSWISDLVPVRKRGKHLAFRSAIASAAALTIYVSAGLFLDSLKSHIIAGFAALFGAIVVFRLSSAVVFTRMYEPPQRGTGLKAVSFTRFITELPHSNLGHFLLYSFALNFGANFSGPFFTVYQLRDLEFSYTAYMGLSVASTLVTIVGLRLWGPFSDRHGNLRIIKVSALGVPLVPLLWLFVNDPLDAMLVQIVAGLAWAGLNLCAVNFVYESSTDANRANNVAYYNALNGVALFLGGVTGGLVVEHLPAIKGSAILTLFVLSGVLRYAAAFMFLPFVKEVRRHPHKPEAPRAEHP